VARPASRQRPDRSGLGAGPSRTAGTAIDNLRVLAMSRIGAAIREHADLAIRAHGPPIASRSAHDTGSTADGGSYSEGRCYTKLEERRLSTALTAGSDR
jgi:hypothetical protein